jgi:hypothetical protein
VTSLPGNALVLPGNDARRVISPLSHLLPDFKCMNGSVIPCPVEPNVSTATYFAFNGSGNMLVDKTRYTCPVSATYTATAASISGVTCSVVSDGIVFNFTLSGAAGLTTISINGTPTYDVALRPTRTSFDDQQILTHSRLIELLGYETETFPRSFFHYNEDGDGNDYFGVLGSVREMLSTPAAVIGVSDPTLTFGDACLNASGTKTISIYDNGEMELKTYRVELGSPIVNSVNRYICSAADPSATAAVCAGKVFDKELRIFDYKTSAIVPKIRVKLNCLEKFGKFFSFDEKDKGAFRRSNRKIIFWNTDLIANHRFEKIGIENEYDITTGTAQRTFERRDMVRMEKIATDRYALWDYGFETKRNGGNWDQRMIRSEYVSGATSAIINYATIPPSIASNPAYDFLLTDSVTYGGERTAAPFASATPTAHGFDLHAVWTNPVDTAGGLNYVGVNGTNNQINGTLSFNLDSLKLLDNQFSN